MERTYCDRQVPASRSGPEEIRRRRCGIFTKPCEPFVIEGKTYALSNQWGLGNFNRALGAMLEPFSQAGITYREADMRQGPEATEAP